MKGRYDMGILVAIEGTDASGKQTQSELAYKKLAERGIKARLISFPAYESESSLFVKKYLAGEFGSEPGDVDAYTASVFYALDRFATYRADWGKDYENGTVIIADRYVPSNMIHQAAKLGTESEKDAFAAWLADFEYNRCGLPEPDAVVFLNMPPDAAQRLMAERANKIDQSAGKDIHERNASYMRRSFDNAVYIAKRLGWRTVMCAENNIVRAVDDINNEVMDIVNGLLTAPTIAP